MQDDVRLLLDDQNPQQEDLHVELQYTRPQLDIFHNVKEKYTTVPKGRRSGLTKGAEVSFIEYALDGLSPLLWVDTINSNIDRYFERYFIPDLSKFGKSIIWDWNAQKKILKINDSIIDFRSAEHPEAIEGFGYQIIFLNEAGIILKDPYLYKHAILPMLLDFPDSRLIAAGTPKGIHLKNGDEHVFYQLTQKALSKAEKYYTRTVTTYENPFISVNEINDMLGQMSQIEAQQEIYGQFVEFTGNDPFAYQFNEKDHTSTEAVHRLDKQLLISLDFNLTPFSVIFAHFWQDTQGWHLHVFDEADIKHGSIPAMLDLLKFRFERFIPSCRLTGDAMGKRGDLSERDNATYYEQLRKGLRLHQAQIVVPGNPKIENSRNDVNIIFYKASQKKIDVKINPVTCKNLIRDLLNVQCDRDGDKVGIKKSDRTDINQRADYLDAFRYLVNTFLYDWIRRNSVVYK